MYLCAMEQELKRLNKFISETGYCSRREADKLIEEGRVTLNGVVPEMGTKVSPDDEVRIDGKLISEKRGKHVYLAFHKPVGIECTTNLEVKNNNVVIIIITITAAASTATTTPPLILFVIIHQ